ncbi:hypothetical protein XENTR_v10021930 [Xenopus tropicalis]|nr:hypothetical protein XENTR_v10021930 [Xenopus tropicalis]
MNDSREEELSWNMEEQGLSASNISRNSQMFMGYFIAAAANLLVVTVMLSLGCTMEILEIKKHLLKPKGIGIALFSQFGIMPLAAFSLAHVFQLNAIESVTVLICGCCPGGVLSSVFSLALKGDINLSLVLDMEPIHNAVPLEKIIEILVLTVFPCCSGILINTKRPQYSGWVVKRHLSNPFSATSIYIWAHDTDRLRSWIQHICSLQAQWTVSAYCQHGNWMPKCPALCHYSPGLLFSRSTWSNVCLSFPSCNTSNSGRTSSDFSIPSLSKNKGYRCHNYSTFA